MAQAVPKYLHQKKKKDRGVESKEENSTTKNRFVPGAVP
jgi:hypothetical protein